MRLNRIAGYNKQRFFFVSRITLILVVIGISFFATAQKRAMIHGYLLDSIKYSPIKNGTVLNTNSNKSVKTNDKGIFSIPVAVNDVLYFTGDNYHFDTLRYNM